MLNCIGSSISTMFYVRRIEFGGCEANNLKIIDTVELMRS